MTDDRRIMFGQDRRWRRQTITQTHDDETERSEGRASTQCDFVVTVVGLRRDCRIRIDRRTISRGSRLGKNSRRGTLRRLQCLRWMSCRGGPRMEKVASCGGHGGRDARERAWRFWRCHDRKPRIEGKVLSRQGRILRRNRWRRRPIPERRRTGRIGRGPAYSRARAGASGALGMVCAIGYAHQCGIAAVVLPLGGFAQ